MANVKIKPAYYFKMKACSTRCIACSIGISKNQNLPQMLIISSDISRV